MSLNISLARPDHAQECNEFFNRIYGSSRSNEAWNWEFFNSPHPAVLALVHDGESLVATQALMPIELVGRDGNRFLSAKSEETLVSPDHRGMGLFEKMYEFLLEHARRQDIKAIWGFTPATKPFERIGFETPAKTAQVVLALHSDGVNKFGNSKGEQNVIERSAGFAIGFYGDIASRLATRVHGLRRSQEDGYSLQLEDAASARELGHIKITGSIATSIDRTGDYLQWRFADNPYRHVKFLVLRQRDTVVGWLALSHDDNGLGFIVDFAISQGQSERTVLQHLIAGAVVYARGEGLRALRGWSVSQHPLDRLFRSTAYRAGGIRIPRGEPVVIKVLDSNYSYLKNPDSWFITRAFTEGHLG